MILMSIRHLKNRWYAGARFFGENLYLGCFREREWAQLAYEAARAFRFRLVRERRWGAKYQRLERDAKRRAAIFAGGELSQGELKRRLDYDARSGQFRWKAAREDYFPEALVGKVAGKTNKKGYVVIDISGRRYQASRLAWLWVHGKWPRDQVDHINHQVGDNRIENLRPAGSSEQCWNRRVRREGLKGCYFGPWKSGGKGLGMRRRAKPWRAMITVFKKRIPLGWFETEEEAHEAYGRAAREHFGEYACLG